MRRRLTQHVRPSLRERELRMVDRGAPGRLVAIGLTILGVAAGCASPPPPPPPPPAPEPPPPPVVVVEPYPHSVVWTAADSVRLVVISADSVGVDFVGNP